MGHEKPAVANLGSRLHQDKLVKTKHLRLILENLLLGKARKAKPRFSESTGAPREPSMLQELHLVVFFSLLPFHGVVDRKEKLQLQERRLRRRRPRAVSQSVLKVKNRKRER